MKSILILIAGCLFLVSCKSKTAATDNPGKPATTSGSNDVVQATIDSIAKFKPLQLPVSEEKSDMDRLIPLGYNSHGSFAFLVDEDMGGASGMRFEIIPTYQEFKVESVLGMDDEPDSIFKKNREFIYYALKSQGIKLDNSIKKISLDTLQKNYNITFDVKKTYGAPDPDWDPDRKLLSTVRITYKQGETDYPYELVNHNFTTAHGMYDVYIADYLQLEGEEGLSAFVVVVSEGMGFEGHTRKTIEVISLGVIKGRY